MRCWRRNWLQRKKNVSVLTIPIVSHIARSEHRVLTQLCNLTDEQDNSGNENKVKDLLTKLSEITATDKEKAKSLLSGVFSHSITHRIQPCCTIQSY